MKIALVHDYLNEFGGAERVLLALSEIWPDAPIYTAFYKKGSPAWERFKDKDIRVSWTHYVPFFANYLHSPLRFLAPLIWNSFNFSDFDVVMTSASWYVTKGMRKGSQTIEVCYCHTPPRYLYGYQTAVDWQKYWPVRLYAAIVNHLMRMYDFKAAQRVDYFIANSKNVAERIKKFYRREAVVIYPPVELSRLGPATRRNYFLVVSRIVGGKGLELAVRAANKLKLHLRVVGKAGGYGREYQKIKNVAGSTVEFVGFVEDSELTKLYSGARGFLALAQDEDFGITPVEAMMAGTPVVAYKGGGYVESVASGKTGIFFDKPTVDALVNALKQFEVKKWDYSAIARHAQKFSKERFKRAMMKFIKNVYQKQHE